ncbi:MAG: MaoC family dehydratase N-terminal domain-containing protein [Paracoccaceae bacterium]
MASEIEQTLDINILQNWIGKTETSTDFIDAGRARRMQVTLDREPDFTEGQELPPFWHYLYFNPEVPASRLKEDGHEKLGRFLPPVSLPRRMWAGGKVEIDRPLYCGETCVKTSTIRDVALKDGRSGPLCFVTVDHDFSVEGAHRFTERQNIVYREMPAPGSAQPAGKPAPQDPSDGFAVTPDPVLLFRYSALIFYSHRIHYDADYTRDVEGYPGLVVHGPLIAALLSEFGRNQQHDKDLKSLEIRALSPLFAPDPFHVEARNEAHATRAWARKADGSLAMTVDLTFAP